MKKILLYILVLIVTNTVNAQDIIAKDFDWKKNPKLHTLSEEEAKEQEIIILKDISYEFAFEDEKFFAFYFYHVIIKVNTDDAIKSNNTVYFPTGNVKNIMKIKARVINSKGDVIELNEDDIKVAKDDENRTSNNYFALEGVDIGSEIEYYYLLKKKASYTGSELRLQAKVPIKKMKFSLTCPDHLVFKFITTNGLDDVKVDKSLSKKNRWYLTAYNLKANKKEPMSAWEADYKSVIYKLSKNSYSSNKKLYSYEAAGDYYNQKMTLDLSKKTTKKLNKILKESETNNQKREEDKIRILEDFLKLNFSYNNSTKSDFESISKILENKVYNETGIMKLYSAFLDIMNVQYTYVLTTNRKKNKFYEDFDSYSFLRKELLYFPSIDKYLSPSTVYSRLGFIPADYTDNFGLFIYKNNPAEIDYIEPLDCYASGDTQNITIDFTSDLSLPKMVFEKIEKGHSSRSNQASYDYYNEDSQKEQDKELSLFIHEDLKVKDVKILNKGGKYIGKKPLITRAEIENSDMFVEQAGTKYLFKIGELLGPQLEMYQENGAERQHDISAWYNRSFFHNMIIIIPEGYYFTNLDDLIFSRSLLFEGEESSYFKSTYKVENNKITITINEIYNKMVYPKSYFDKLKNVVNAAADFNKVTLILQKN